MSDISATIQAQADQFAAVIETKLRRRPEHATTTWVDKENRKARSSCEGCDFTSSTGYAASPQARDTAVRAELWLAGQHLRDAASEGAS